MSPLQARGEKTDDVVATGNLFYKHQKREYCSVCDWMVEMPFFLSYIALVNGRVPRIAAHPVLKVSSHDLILGSCMKAKERRVHSRCSHSGPPDSVRPSPRAILPLRISLP